MIAIQLETGKTVFKTLDEWLDMTPEQYQNMLANDEGIELNNPFDKVLDRIKDDEVKWGVPVIPDLPEELSGPKFKNTTDGEEQED